MATSDSPLSVPNVTLAVARPNDAAGIALESGFRISGTIADDAEITITDTSGQGRFGVKPGGSAPLHLWDAEYGDGTWSSLQRFTGSVLNEPLVTFDNSLSAGATLGCLKYNLVPSESGYHIFGNLQLDQDVYPLDSLIVALRLRTNWDGTDAFATNSSWNLKGVRHNGPSGAISSSVPLWGQQGGDGGPRSSGFGNGTIYEGVGVYGMTRFKDTWRTWEELVKFDYVGSESVQAVEVDGKRQQYSGTISPINVADAIQSLSMFQKQNAGAWGLSSHYMATGYIYVDDSLCSVLISNQAAWTTSQDHQRALCIPTAWQSNEITVRLRKRTLTAFSGNSLYVRLSDGSVIKIGDFD